MKPLLDVLRKTDKTKTAADGMMDLKMILYIFFFPNSNYYIVLTKKHYFLMGS